MPHIAIIGAGQAGAALAAKLRAEGFAGAITIFGEEPAPPYQRPPLSKKYLLGQMDRARLFLRPASFYADHNITLETSARVIAIDAASKTLTLQDGRVIAWDKLAITTGTRPRMLPDAIGGALPGALALRTLADVDALAPLAQPGKTALIVGGGYIGLEAAAVLRGLALNVTLLEAAPRILQRVAAPETSAYYRALHTSHGVDLREGSPLTRLTGDAHVTGADLADGTHVAADFALIGIGVHANAELAGAAGLALDNGIAVDAACRTSHPDIVSAGDCASFPWRGRRIRLESVQNAIDQAEAAAETLLGRDVTYDPTPWFWSDQYDVKLQIAGLSTGHDRIITRLGARPGAQSVWYFRGRDLLAVDAMNDPRSYMTAKRWLEAGHSPDPDALAVPDADLKPL
ncbi:MAG: 3-phenylpropionate/trans-cinnamate dioxygenase ferredoxin reductase subunit [Paracoccaceae bacterium]|jgi:3-phenylpropionate/trans-cinnamate dioxygenase ferredoxin reductase subunit